MISCAVYSVSVSHGSGADSAHLLCYQAQLHTGHRGARANQALGVFSVFLCDLCGKRSLFVKRIGAAVRIRQNGALGGFRRRQDKQESRAVVQFALGSDGSSVSKDDVLGDGEAQASSSRFPGARLVDAVKPFE